ncbi:MAG: glycosyltransferase family 2 protein [Verrucomicrobia bacterium]|nr:glycosyltransferase family 2 protein [Verrucomicrobiota bacterium]
MQDDTPQRGRSLSLIIPALNEAQAVGETLTRAMDAARGLTASGALTRCEVILVNDGSTDDTLERARAIPGVKVISYKQNRGYGRAIETGFATASGDWLAFMDADGTCDPAFLRNLLDEAERTGADTVLGSRLHQQSKMPVVRRIGNTFYAWLLRVISGKPIGDTASGMRILKRELLARIHPLPHGLAYTPAMSARCIMDPTLRLAEIDMPYSERQGESKLSVVRDGLRFLHTILVTGLFYSPIRVFGGLGLAGGAAGMLVVALIQLLRSPGRDALLPLSVVILSSAAAVVALGVIFHYFSKQIIPEFPTTRAEIWIHRVFTVPVLLSASAVLWLVSFVLAFPARTSPVGGGALQPHAAMLVLHLALLCLIMGAGVFIVGQMKIWQVREDPASLLANTLIFEPDAAEPGPGQTPPEASTAA